LNQAKAKLFEGHERILKRARNDYERVTLSQTGLILCAAYSTFYLRSTNPFVYEKPPL